MWVLFQGLFLGATLIIAIGAQNAHVLRMGIQHQHVFLTVLVCILCDTFAISLGALGAGSFIQQHYIFLLMSRFAGAIFLFYYGFCAFKRAIFANSSFQVMAQQQNIMSFKAIQLALAVSLLNPHMYLDTVVLLGSFSARQSSFYDKLMFSCGAILASSLWFCALGWGAKKLSYLFKQPKAWQILDGAIAILMFVLAVWILVES